MSKHGWIGVDLDATLATYDKWIGIEHIGDPVPAMLKRVKRWLAEGRDVRILTARVSHGYADRDTAARYIQDWTERHLGVRLPVTCEKDMAMLELWDDRAVTVEANTGRQLAPSSRGLEEQYTSEIGYLIEDTGGAWWCGPDEDDWTRDPNTAVRFCRAEDAERVRSHVGLESTKVTEHMWCSRA